MTDDERDRLAAEYVLGLLEGEEAARAERLLAGDRAFAADVERWRTHFAELDATAAPAPLSDALWHRIEAGIAAEDRPDAVRVTPLIVPDPRNAFRALWRSLSFWRMAGLAMTAASLLLAVGVYWTAAFMSDAVDAERARKPMLVAVLVKEGTNQPAAVVNAFAGGAVELIPLETIDVPHNHALEI